MNTISRILKQFDNNKYNLDKGKIDSITTQITPNNPLNLILFTCSTIDARYMFDIDKFDQYVSLDPTGNNLTNDIYILKDILSELEKEMIPYKLNIIIGNTDPYYIYSLQLSLLSGIDKSMYLQRMNIRWELYKNNLTKWINNILSSTSNYEVISWYEFENTVSRNLKWDFEILFDQIKEDSSKLFDADDLKWEFNKLKTNFGAGKYFENLAIPDESILKKWIINKFTEYAIQGLWIYLFFPNAVLLQNEKPTDLRYKMYQPLLKKYMNTSLPNIYPFGIDNSGYQ